MAEGVHSGEGGQELAHFCRRYRGLILHLSYSVLVEISGLGQYGERRQHCKIDDIREIVFL
jgi:hypothetical protein